MTSADHHWHEYRLRFVGDLARDATRAAGPLTIGVLASFLLTLAVGIVGEEGLAGYIYAEPLEAESSRSLTEAVDLATRMALGVIVGCGLAVWVIHALTDTLWQIATTRALLAAARSGAPRTEVPSPHQAASLKTRFESLRNLSIATAATAGLASLVLIISAFDGSATWSVALGALGVAAAAGGVILARRRWLIPSHLRWRTEIFTHWQQADWILGGKDARSATSVQEELAQGITHNPLVRVGGILVRLTGIILGGAYLLFFGLVLTTHPDALLYRNAAGGVSGELGERAALSPSVERIVDLGFVGFFAITIAALLAALLGTLIESAGHTAEKRIITTALDNPEAGSPPVALLGAYIDRRSGKLIQVIHAVATIAFVIGLSILILGTTQSETFARSGELFGDLAGPAKLVAVGAAVAILLAITADAVMHRRSLPLRNQIIARWPIHLPED